jgi:hypothetical protein
LTKVTLFSLHFPACLLAVESETFSTMATTSSSSSSNNLVAFRAAVSLNNMGVCTMEHGHFAAALETLKDSLSMMKHIILCHQQPADPTIIIVPPPHDYSSHHLQQEEKLQAARRRLALAQAQPFVMNDLNIQPCDDGNVTAMKIPMVMMQQEPCVRNKADDDDMGAPPVFIPIRLESSSHELPSGSSSSSSEKQEQKEELDQILRIPSAVILYNYGLTHILAHLQNKTSSSEGTTTTPAGAESSSRHESSSSSLLHGGIVCFTCAHGILCQARQAAGQQHHQHAVSFEILQAMLISGLVLRNLFFMFLLNRQVQTAHDVMHSLSSLLYIIQVHEDVLRNMNVELENCKTACAA